MDQLKGGLQKLLGALVHRGVTAALQTVDRLGEKLEEVTSRGGVVMGAAGRRVLRRTPHPGTPTRPTRGLTEHRDLSDTTPSTALADVELEEGEGEGPTVATPERRTA